MNIFGIGCNLCLLGYCLFFDHTWRNRLTGEKSLCFCRGSSCSFGMKLQENNLCLRPTNAGASGFLQPIGSNHDIHYGPKLLMFSLNKMPIITILHLGMDRFGPF